MPQKLSLNGTLQRRNSSQTTPAKSPRILYGTQLSSASTGVTFPWASFRYDPAIGAHEQSGGQLVFFYLWIKATSPFGATARP